jgi:lipoprotein-releasing system ATP-binding protein
MADLTVERLRKEYTTRGEPLVVLDDISFELNGGDNLAIVGPSGSGKSTLLHIVGTLDWPTAGQVRLQGQDPFQLSERELAHFRNQKVGFVFQDHYLLPQLSALENVLVPTLAQGKPSAMVSDRARHLLEQVGLSARTSHRPAELSGGERQRVAIARALIHQPVLLMADEPTGNLDRTTAESVTDLLLDLQQRAQPPSMMIVVTHSESLAKKLQDCRELDVGLLK